MPTLLWERENVKQSTLNGTYPNITTSWPKLGNMNKFKEGAQLISNDYKLQAGLDMCEGGSNADVCLFLFCAWQS